MAPAHLQGYSWTTPQEAVDGPGRIRLDCDEVPWGRAGGRSLRERGLGVLRGPCAAGQELELLTSSSHGSAEGPGWTILQRGYERW